MVAFESDAFKGALPSRTGLVLLGLGVVLYIAAVPLARMTVFPVANVALFWFPTAIFAGLIARLPLRWLPALAAAQALAEFCGTQVFEGVSFTTVWLWVLATTSEAVLVGVALKLVRANRLERPFDLLKFALTVPIVVVFSAAMGALAVHVTFGSQWWPNYLAWFSGDLSGLLILVPFFLSVQLPKKGMMFNRNRILEGAALIAVTLGIAAWAFTTPSSQVGLVLRVSLLVPMLVWIALRFGIAPVAATAPVVVLIAAVSAARSVGPFEGTTPDVALLVPIQGVLVLVCLTAYAAGTVAVANKRAEALLFQQATQDSLTGLLNRRALLDAMKRSRPARSSGGDRAVLFCDLRGFKQINDLLGHAAGDEALIETARRLKAIVGNSGIVSRFGGDEFVILIEDEMTRAWTAETAGRIAESIGRPMRISGGFELLGVDIGIAFDEVNNEFPEEAVTRADVALLECKRNSEESTVFFSKDLEQRMRTRLSSQVLIQQALEAGSIEAWLQPIVESDTGRVVGAEALARIRTSDGRVHYPHDFIAVADQTGMIVALGESVLNQALDWLKVQNLAHPELEVAVNVSPRQLHEPGFVETVTNSIEARSLDPTRLILEVTEQTVLDFESRAVCVLQTLKSNGIRIAIDDFGTGYSSLTALRQVPADIVKVDQSFVAGILESSDDEAIVRAIIRVSHDLDRVVVAEGVESGALADKVNRLGAEYSQGHFYAPPAPAKDFSFAALPFNRAASPENQVV